MLESKLMDMIIFATIKTIYQKGHTGKIVKTGKIKYNCL